MPYTSNIIHMKAYGISATNMTGFAKPFKAKNVTVATSSVAQVIATKMIALAINICDTSECEASLR